MAEGIVDNLSISISADAQKAEKSLQQLREKLQNLQRALNIDTSSLMDIGSNFSAQKKHLTEFGTEIRKIKTQVSKLSKISLDGVLDDFRELGQIDFSNLSNLAGIDFKGLLKYQKNIQNTTNSVTGLDEALEGVKSNLVLDGLNTTQLEKGLQKVQKELKKFLDQEQYLQLSGQDWGRPWEKLQYNIALANSDIEAYEEALDRIRMKSNITIERADGLGQNVDTDQPRTTTVSSDAFNYNPDAMRAVFPEYAEIKNFSELMGQLGKNAAQSGMEINQSLDGVGVSASEASKEVEKLASTKPDVNRWQQLTATILEFGKAVREIGKIIKKVFSGMANTVQKISSIISGVSKNFGKLAKNLSGIGKKKNSQYGMLQMLGTSILFSSVFQTIGAIQNAIKTGSDNLTMYSAQYNASISSMTSSLLTLKNAWAAAFSPIVNVVAPALSAFIDMISRALNTVGQFFAALTGKTFTVQAIKVSQDYAAGLSDVGSGAGEAADGVKELDKALSVLSFDQLNQLQAAPDTSSSGSGGGDGGAGGAEISPSEMFTDVPIADYIQDFVERLKDSWEEADFYWLGETLGEKINDALRDIPWNKIKKTAAKLGKSLATFLNGGIETTDGRLMGKTIAEVINTGLAFTADFVENFHFDSLGEFIADGINGAIQNINLRDFDRTLNGLSKGLSKGINNLFEKIANSHFPRPARPHFPASQGHIKRSALEIGRARGAPPC